MKTDPADSKGRPAARKQSIDYVARHFTEILECTHEILTTCKVSRRESCRAERCYWKGKIRRFEQEKTRIYFSKIGFTPEINVT
jgi:hypothetical protein